MTDLVEIQTEPDQDLIEWLEQLLESAKEGHIRGMSAAWVGPRGHASHGWISGGGLLSRLLIAQHMILQTDMAAARGLAEHDSYLSSYIED